MNDSRQQNHSSSPAKAGDAVFRDGHDQYQSVDLANWMLRLSWDDR
jgi:hypothetical protein